MPRPPTPRPAGDHLVTLTRVLRQVEVDPDISTRRKATLMSQLNALLAEFQQLMKKGAK